jgi:long-chain acyl-CoA synthetase
MITRLSLDSLTQVTTSTPSEPGKTRRPRTIANLWREGSRRRSGTAYLVEGPDGWREVTWAEAAAVVEELANGLLALGVRRGDGFAILGSTHLEWALFDFALAHVGAVVAPIYANNSPADVAYVLRHSDAVGVLVENDEQRAKVEAHRSEVPRCEHVLAFADLDELRERGRAFAAKNPGALDAAADAIDEDDLFTYIYTSGTTGPPKACMIRNRNYYAMVENASMLEGVLREDDVVLLYLPLAHNYGRLVHLEAPFVGFTIAFLPDPMRAAEALPQVRPTLFPSVPRVYEKIYTAISAQFAQATGVKRRLIDWALAVGYRVSAHKQRGEGIPRGLALQQRIADKLVYSKVKVKLGGRLRLANAGGAPLAKEIAEFFHALDILILEGYGLSECTTAATVNRPDAFRFGTVGLPLPGVELAIEPDGEVLIRSATVFKGYFKDEEATREVLSADGWLRTGDIGEIDADGFLVITDRKKDLIVTAGGKNIAPQNLENDLKGSRFVSQALVVGDRKPFVAALVTLDEVEIRKWADERGIDGDLSGLARDERVRALIQEVVDYVNRDRSRYEQIKQFVILPRDFSMDEGEVTPTLKLKRKVCQEHFAAELAEIYS